MHSNHAQGITALLWAGGAAARLSHLEVQVAQTEELSERTARLEEQASHILASLRRIETKIDDTLWAEQ